MSEETRKRIRRGFDRLAVIVGCVTMGASWIFSLMLIEDVYMAKRAKVAAKIYDSMVAAEKFEKTRLETKVLEVGTLSEEQKSDRVLEAWTEGRLSAEHERQLSAVRKWTPKTIFIEICALAGGFLVGWIPVKAVGWAAEALV